MSETENALVREKVYVHCCGMGVHEMQIVHV
jgi:hypothetical protein